MADSIEFGIKVVPVFSEFDTEVSQHQSKEPSNIPVVPDFTKFTQRLDAFSKKHKAIKIAITPVKPKGGLRSAVNALIGSTTLKIPIKPDVSKLRSELNAAVTKLSKNGANPVTIKATAVVAKVDKSSLEIKDESIGLPVIIDVNQTSIDSQVQSITEKIRESLEKIEVTPEVKLKVSQNSPKVTQKNDTLTADQVASQTRMLTQLESFQRKYQSVLQIDGTNTALGDEVQGLVDKLSKVDTGTGLSNVKNEISGVEARVKSLAATYQDASREIQYLVKSSATSGDWEDRWNRVSNILSNLHSEAENVQSDINGFSLPQKFIDDLTGLATRTSNNASKAMKQAENRGVLTDNLGAVRDNYAQLQNIMGLTFDGDNQQFVQNYTAAIQRLDASVKLLVTDIANVETPKMVSTSDVTRARNEFEALGKSWSNLFKNSSLAEQYKNILGKFNFTMTTSQFEALQLEIENFRMNVIAAGADTQTFGDKVKNTLGSLGSFVSIASAMRLLVQGIKSMVNAAIELDSKVTDLQIASGNTRDEVRQMIDDYAEMGKELGATAVDVATAADTFLRQGESNASTAALVKDSLMLSKLGQIDTEEASSALTSAMKGYGVDSSDAESIVDKLTAVDMEAAASAGGIAKAMAETATSADLAGISMDRLIGYLTTVIEVTQAGDEEVGNFFKSTLSRMSNIKAGRLSDPTTGDDLSNVETTLHGLGISLRDSDSEFRNFGDVLDEVSGKWDSFSSVQQRAIATAFAGTLNQEKFLALMQNYDQAMGYMETSANSAGNAAEKYNAYLDSVESKTESFQAAFQQLSNDVIDSDLVSGAIGTGTGILSFLDQMVKKIGALSTLGVGGVFASGLKNVSKKGNLLSVLSDAGMIGTGTDIGQLSQAYMQLTSQQQRAYLMYNQLTNGAAGLTAARRQELLSLVGLIKQGSTFNITAAEAALRQAGFTAEQTKSLAALMASSGGLNSNTIALKSNAEAIVEAMVAGADLSAEKKAEIVNHILSTASINAETTSLKANLTARLAMMAADPMTWISLALALIPMIVNWVNNYTTALEKHTEALNEASQAYDTAQGEVESLQQTIAQNVSEIESLDASDSSDLAKIENLRIQNEELEKQLKLKQQIEQQDLSSLAQEFQETVSEINKRDSRDYKYELSDTGQIYETPQNLRIGETQRTYEIGNDDLIRQTDKYLRMYGISYEEILSLRQQYIEQLQSKLTDLNQQYVQAINSADTEVALGIEQQMTDVRKQIETQSGFITSAVDQLSSAYTQIINAYGSVDNISDTGLLSAIKFYQKWRDVALELSGSTRDETAIEAVISSDANAEAVASLKQLASQGELTADVLNSQDYGQLTQTLLNLGATIDWIIDKFIQLAGGVTDTDTELAPLSGLEAYIAKTSGSAASVKSALITALEEYDKDGTITKDSLTKLDEVLPGTTDLLFDQNGEWTQAGQTILGYSDNVGKATAALYAYVIAAKQAQLAQLDPNADDYNSQKTTLEQEIEDLTANREEGRNAWQSEAEFDNPLENIDSLREAMADLQDGSFEFWDADAIESLTDAFPDLSDEIEDFADGSMEATDLIDEMQDAIDASLYDEFIDALDEVNDAVEDYGENSYQAQEALENLESIVPGVSSLFYTEDGALTDVGQAAILAADGHIEAANAMLQAALVAAQLDLSNVVAEWNAVAAAADQAALSSINAAYASMAGTAQQKVTTIKSLVSSLQSNKSSFGGSSKKSSGGGGSSSKTDVLEEYKTQKKILQHRADMSESAQDLMQEETDEWRNEQQKQYDIYLEYAALIEAEMERLRQLGYDSESEEMMTLESDLAKVKKSMYSLQKEVWESQRDAQIDALKKQKEALEDAWEEEEERMEAEIDRQEALINLLEKQYDLTNDIRDQRNELAEQLATSQTYVGLSDEERKALFSDEDYAQLMGVLDEIQNEAVVAYNEYTDQIKSVNTDEAYKLDYITQQYEAQYELMSKKYDVAVQELAVARARIALENAQQNRNVAMIVDGKWTWSADPEAVQDAVEDIYNAEQDRSDAQSAYIQQEKLNEMEGFKASLELEKDAAEQAHEAMIEEIEDMIDALEEMEFAFDETIENLYGVADQIESAGGAIASAASAAAAAIAAAGGGGGGGGGDDDNTSSKTSTKKSSGKKSGTSNNVVKIEIKESGLSAASGSGRSTISNASSRKLTTLSLYADGGVNTETGPAILHGTTKSPEVVFNATDAAKLYDIVHNGNPVASMTEQIKAQIRNATANMANAVPDALQPIQYIINGLTLGEESGGLTLKQFATQLSSAAPFLK